jgi:anti-sigma B factor antagonist
MSYINLLEADIHNGEADHAAVTLAGELDTSNVARFCEELAELPGEGIRHITFDIAELEFVDSTGMSAIITARKRDAASGGELIVLAPSDDTRRLFEITGIDTFLNLLPGRR